MTAPDPMRDLLAALILYVAAVNSGSPRRIALAAVAHREAALAFREAMPWWARADP